MEVIFQDCGKQTKCHGFQTKMGHCIEPKSVSIMSNFRLQCMFTCSNCGMTCTKIRRRQYDYNANTESSFSDYFYMQYANTESLYHV